MASKAAIFCHKGLGDAVVSLVLSNNLHLNGWHVDTYNGAISGLQKWVPHLNIKRYLEDLSIEQVLNRYDWFFIVHDDANPFVLRLINEGKRRFPERVKVIYAYPSSRVRKEPYYDDMEIDPSLPFGESLQIFCRNKLHLERTTRSNGFIPPPHLVSRKYTHRVVIHPTGSRASKNWPKERFVMLAKLLCERGFTPVWIVGPHEREEWLDGNTSAFGCPEFFTLDDLAQYVYESGYFIGNDSGPGHLASYLGVPTITVARRKAYAQFSAPSYASRRIVTPSQWIPNIRGLRIRDKYWHTFISPKQVLRAFLSLANSSIENI